MLSIFFIWELHVHIARYHQPTGCLFHFGVPTEFTKVMAESQHKSCTFGAIKVTIA